jgi:N-acetylmuramoyl-L-alanine amidase
MLRGLLALLLIVLALPVASSVAAAKPVVSDVRIGVHDGYTRFVIDLSETVSWRVFTLGDPYRLVIDLPELVWNLPSELPPGKKGLIGALRYGLFAPGQSRVVLDLADAARIERVELLPPTNGVWRLFVDLSPISEAAFADPGVVRMLESAVPLPQAEGLVGISPVPTPAGDERPLVVIDAGHGGIDPGATGVSGIQEKELVLDYALALKDALEASGHYRVLLTREEDLFIPLNDRYDIAQRAEADLFISFHANSHPKEKVRGASIFTLSEKGADSDAEAAQLAAKENAADALAGVEDADDVALILGDLMRRETMNLSKNFANRLVSEIGRETKLLRNTHRFANFTVLRSPTVPSVLVEIGYLSNEDEEKLMRTKKHREAVAGAILRAIDSYFSWQQALNRS